MNMENKVLNYCNIKNIKKFDFFLEDINCIEMKIKDSSTSIFKNYEKGFAFNSNKKNISKSLEIGNNVDLIKLIDRNEDKSNISIKKGYKNVYIKNKIDCIDIEELVRSKINLKKYEVNLKFLERQMHVINNKNIANDYFLTNFCTILKKDTGQEINLKADGLNKINKVELEEIFSINKNDIFIGKCLRYDYIKLSEEINSVLINILANYLMIDKIDFIKSIEFSDKLNIEDFGNYYMQDYYKNFDAFGNKKKKLVLINNGIIEDIVIERENYEMANLGRVYRSSYKQLPRVKWNFIIQKPGDEKNFKNIELSSKCLELKSIYYESFKFDFYSGEVSFKSQASINNNNLDIYVEGNIFNIYKNIVEVNNYIKNNYIKKVNKIPAIIIKKQSLKIKFGGS